MSLSTLPLTDSTTQTNNDGTRVFFCMIMIHQDLSTRDSFCSTSTTKQLTSGHDFDANSVHSHSTAATDTSSVASNDVSILASPSVHKTPFAKGQRRSILKRENRPRRLQQDVLGIQFNLHIQQQGHLALHEYSTEERDACWFRGEEHAQIARSCCKEIDMLERGTLLKNPGHRHDDKYCPRGLESHTRLAVIAKNRNRRVAWDAVLDEQFDESSSLAVINDEAIASAYRDASSSSILWAIRVGQQDQRVAELVYDSMLD